MLPLCLNFYQIQTVSHEAVVEKLKRRLSKLDKKDWGLDFEINRTPGKKLIYVFGASAVTQSERGYAPETVFAGKLEKKLENVQVENLAVDGVDSFYIRSKVIYATKLHKPDLVVFYAGDNDLNNGWLSSIRPKYSFFDDSLFPLILGLFKMYQDDPERISRQMFDPKALSFFSDLGLFEPSDENFKKYESLMLSYFNKNTSFIIEHLSSISVPMIFVTPIGNLMIPPIAGKKWKQLFEDALQQPYEDKIRSLVKVRDHDWLSSLSRSRTSVIESVLAHSDPTKNVWTFDLQKHLEDKGADFGEEYFWDLVHLTEKTHEIIASQLALLIESNGILESREIK